MVDPRGRVAGVLSIEILAHALQTARGVPSGAARVILELAQLQIHTAHRRRCVSNNGFCPDWIVDNFDRYVAPVLAARLPDRGVGRDRLRDRLRARARRPPPALAHRADHAASPAILYTIPSVAAFFLLLPITGRGNNTALIALVSYTLLIIFRNVSAGLDNVPEETRDAARGMGLTERQLLWRVELPLALPEIMAGLRIATTTTVGLATLAFFAGAGGLGRADLLRHHLQVERGGRGRAGGAAGRRARR